MIDWCYAYAEIQKSVNLEFETVGSSRLDVWVTSPVNRGVRGLTWI